MTDPRLLGYAPIVPPAGSDDPNDRNLVTVMTTRSDLKVPSIDPADACLVVIYGEELGRRLRLGSGVVEAGRSSKCDLAIDQESVSRHHARVSWTGLSYRVQDLGSTNGTFVNDARIEGEKELADGDQLRIGRTILKFMTGGNVEASYHEEIYRLMTIDALTRVHNKRYFHETLEREVSRCTRYQRAVSLILFDIDHFKKKNDTFGHLAGDAVLRDLATAIKPRVRREDLIARVGGEEFAVLTPEVGLEGALGVAEKIRHAVETTTFRYDKHVMPTTVSLGVAELTRGETGHELYRRADERLYAAKQGGRNRVM